MSPFTTYLADPTDPSYGTVAVDLNGYEHGFGIFETDPDTFDLGAPALEGTWLSDAGHDEDVLAAHRRGRVEASFDLRLAGTPGNIDEITRQVRDLNSALDRGGVWVIQQPGAAAPVFVDFYPSPLVNQLMPGARSLYLLWQQLIQPNGMRVTILRRPKMRGPMLDAGVNLAHNGTFAEDHNLDGIPSLWAWDSTAGLTAIGYDWAYGAHSAAFATAAPHYLYQTADSGLIAAGHSFTFAASIAATYSLLPVIRARIEWLDATGTQLGDPVYGPAPVFVLPPRLDWNRVAIAGAFAPPGAVGARYGIEVTPQSTSVATLWIRDAQLEVGSTASDFRAGFETISQHPGDPFYKRIWCANRGNADALANLRATPATGRPIVVSRLTYSRRSGERDSAMAMAAPVTGWGAAASTALLNGSTAVADGSATVVRSSLRNDVMRSVLRQASLTSDESALRGTWRVRAALRGDLGDAYDVVGAYGFGDVADLPFTTLVDPRRLDLTAPPASAAYYSIDLGLIRVPPLAPGVYLELRALRESGGAGTGQIYVEQLWLEPADDDVYASAEVPGLRLQGPVSETVIGRKLITPPDGLANDPASGLAFVAGSIYNDDLWLNDLREACSLPAASTSALTAGVEHTYSAFLNLFTVNEKSALVHGELRVHDLTHNAQVARVVVRNDAGVAWCWKTFVVRFTPAASTAYLVYVVQTVATSVGNIHVQKLAHSFVPPIVGGTDTIAVDGDQRLAYILTPGGQIKAPLALAPPFLSLEPGVQLVRLALSGLGPNGSDVVLDGGPAQAHDGLLSARVGVHHVPRWYN